MSKQKWTFLILPTYNRKSAAYKSPCSGLSLVQHNVIMYYFQCLDVWHEVTHVAQDIAALCSLAFILKAAMLDDFRSGSLLMSNVLMAAPSPAVPKRPPMCPCPTWLPGAETPRNSDTPACVCACGDMQEVTVSQGTTQAGTGDEAPLLPIQDGFWICKTNVQAKCQAVVSCHVNGGTVTSTHAAFTLLILLLL